ncbi:MAG: short-subunit dehydrogenase, partial [Paraglaciecola psychrophila]
LIITARRTEKLQQLAADLAGTVTVKVISGDLAKPKAVEKLLRDIANTPIDVLVNNAGIAYPGKFQQQEYDDIFNLLSVNIVALTRLSHAILPSMIARGSGKILNVASVASFQPVPSMSIYAASKAFVLSLTESLSEELKGTGVSATALCPGLTDTDLVDDLQAGNVPQFMMSSVKDVAREGYDATMNNEVIRIPGLSNQAAIAWAKHQPRWLVRGLGSLFSQFSSSK